MVTIAIDMFCSLLDCCFIMGFMLCNTIVTSQ